METGSKERQGAPDGRETGAELSRRAALKCAGAGMAATLLPASGAWAQTGQASAPPPSRTIGGRTLTGIVADYAAGSTMQAIPAPVREQAKKVIFDEMASGYFGRTSEGGTLAAKYVAQCGGPAETRVYGTHQRAPVQYAALANGTAGHGYEVDGAHVVGGHPGASIVHAATAVAERQKASGAELLNAVVLGYDVGVRMVEGCGGMFTIAQTKHLQSDLLYSLGACAAAGRLIRLDAARQAHAWALVTFQANGLNALFSEKRHISKSFCNGQYAFAGVSAAMMAQIGLEGNEDIIGAKDGLLDAWGDGAHETAITAGLGAEFKIRGANIKFYNAGYPIHAAIEAAMTLIAQKHLAPDNIAAIEIGMPRSALGVVNNRAMHNISVQDMVAANIASGGLKLVDTPFPAMLSNPRFTRLRSVITAVEDAGLQRDAPNGRGARVTITMRDGTRHSMRVDAPRGNSQRGEISWADLAEKWHKSLPGCDVDAAISVARRLDELPDASPLFAAFGGVNTGIAT